MNIENYAVCARVNDSVCLILVNSNNLNNLTLKMCTFTISSACPKKFLNSVQVNYIMVIHQVLSIVEVSVKFDITCKMNGFFLSAMKLTKVCRQTNYR